MNWYNIFKFSALEAEWWINMRHHMAAAVPFVMGMQGSQLHILVNEDKVHGINYKTQSFAFSVIFFTGSKHDRYTVVMALGSDIKVLPGSEPKLKPLTILLNLSKNVPFHIGSNDSEDIEGPRKKIWETKIEVKKTTPFDILNKIKELIIADRRDGDNEDDTPQVPQAPNNHKKINSNPTIAPKSNKLFDQYNKLNKQKVLV